MSDKKLKIDNFILKEAIKFLGEAEDSSSKIKQIEDDYSTEKEMLEVDIKQLESEVKELRSQQQAFAQQTSLSFPREPEKKQSINSALKSSRELKPAKEKLIKSKKDRLKDMEFEKKDMIQKIKSSESELQQSSNLEVVQSESYNIKEAVAPSQQLRSSIPQNTVPKKSIQQQPSQQIEKPKKDLIVRFDTDTTTPFTVKFTNRGFVVGNTRLSFELLDKAISKQFSITLKSGLVLTPVKMQKILKYKNRF